LPEPGRRMFGGAAVHGAGTRLACFVGSHGSMSYLVFCAPSPGGLDRVDLEAVADDVVRTLDDTGSGVAAGR